MSNKTHEQPSPLTYFICYKNYRKYLSKLTAGQVGELHLALYDFAFDGVVREFGDLSVQLLYDIMIDQISRDSDRYLTKVENGRRGGRPRKNPEPAETSAISAEKPKITSKTALLSHFPDPVKTEENRIITENNQDNEEEYEEDNEQDNDEDNEEDEEEYTEHSFSSPTEENECSAQDKEEEQEQEEYAVRAPIAPGLDDGDGSRNRLGAFSGVRQQERLDERAIGREEDCGELPQNEDGDEDADPYYFELCVPDDDDEDRLNSLLSGDCCPLPHGNAACAPPVRQNAPSAKSVGHPARNPAPSTGGTISQTARNPAPSSGGTVVHPARNPAPSPGVNAPAAAACAAPAHASPGTARSRELEEGFRKLIQSMFGADCGDVSQQETTQEQMGALASYAKQVLFNRV